MTKKGCGSQIKGMWLPKSAGRENEIRIVKRRHQSGLENAKGRMGRGRDKRAYLQALGAGKLCNSIKPKLQCLFLTVGG